MIKGDGSRINGKCNYVSYNPNLLAQFQLVATLIGRKAALNEQYKSVYVKENRGQFSHVAGNVSRTRHYGKWMEWYDGFVYCVSVPSSFVMIRRNGKI